MSNTFGVAAAVQALREGKNLSGNEKSLACSHWASTSPSSASSVCGQRDITHSAQGAKPMNRGGPEKSDSGISGFQA